MGWGGKRDGAGRKPNGDKPSHLTVVSTDGKPVEAKPAGDTLKLTFSRSGLDAAIARARRPAHVSPFTFPAFPAAATPPNALQLGQDAALKKLNAWAGAQDSQVIVADPFSFGPGAFGFNSNAFGQGMHFLGYTFLAELMQRAEYRVIVETIAEEMTRKWIKVQSKSDDKGKEDEVKAVTDFMEALHVREVFELAAIHDGSFGRSHIYIETGEGDTWEDREELETPIGDGADRTSEAKVSRETPIRRLVNVEPVWAYPTNYNSSNPIAPNWYKPSEWFVMARPMHATRLLTMVGRPVPDLLKPAYAFGGLSMVQMAMPYVNRWLRTVANVNRLINNFSVVGLKTDLQTSLQSDGEQLFKRVELFNQFRDNNGLMLLQQGAAGAGEEFWNVAVPLGTLDKLQAQAQEHMAAVSRIPLVKLLGISPTGLNATAEPEIRVFYDHILAYQEKFFRVPLTTIFHFAQLSVLGKVDPDLTFAFEPLWSLDEKAEAEVRKSDSDTDVALIDAGVLHPAEVRKRIANDPDTPYAGIDVDDVPDLLEEEEEGLEPEGGRPQPQAGKTDKEVESGEGGGRDAVLPFARDAAEWSEADHPRAPDGKFGGKGSGGSMPEMPDFLKRGQIKAPQLGMPYGSFTAKGPGSEPSKPKGPRNLGAPIKMGDLTKVGGQKGSNPGGVYEGEGGKRYYVKTLKSQDHVRNEMIAAALYDLAGTPTLKYRPVEGGKQVATEIEKLDKDNAKQLSPKEVADARKDFAVHAWLANWDAVGLGGDNLGTARGKVLPLDMGGALEFRAQGAPKGAAFGEKVGEVNTLRDAKMNPDAAGIFGGMTPAELRESARYVTGIKDEAIRAAVEAGGGKAALADKLIARKEDLAKRARTFGAEGDPRKADGVMVVPHGDAVPVKELHGVPFKPWHPPSDWASVPGQAEIDEPEFKPEGGKKPGSGVIIREPDGRVWLVQPRGGYGGYEATFPKGGLEEGLSLQANAIKEAWEETGLKVRITGLAGDGHGDVTATRYYYAEREGGDPSQHDDESEGVVLAPTDKLKGFVNRTRDQQIAASLAGDEFKEAEHPRDSDGKFSSTGGGGGSKLGTSSSYQDFAKKIDELIHGGFHKAAAELAKENPDFMEQLAKEDPQAAGEVAIGGGPEALGAKPKKTAFGGLWKVPAGEDPDSPKTLAANIDHVLSKPANAGQSYRQMLAHMVKKATELGTPTLAGLKAKLAEAMFKAVEKAQAAGNAADVSKLQAALAKMEKADPEALGKGAVAVGAGKVPPAKPAATKPAPKTYQQFKQQVAEAKAKGDDYTAEQLLKWNQDWAFALKQEFTAAMAEKKAAAQKFPSATAQEMEKAKKNVALQLQYVPNAPQGGPEAVVAQKYVDEFNEKYANKQITDPAGLGQKVQDFKAMQAKIASITEEQKKEAAAAAQAQAAKLKAQAQAEAKAAAEKNKGVMQDLGITEQEAEGFVALVKMIGGKQADVVAQFKGYENKAKSYGYPISGFQAALIGNYTDGGFGAINKALRSGSWTTAQHVYVKMVNKALQSMPTYTGTVQRGTTLSKTDQALYKVGHVVEERAFTSTSVSAPWSGNVKYTIKAIGKRGAHVKKLSNHPSEDEVVFSARTFFKVTKVDGEPGGNMHVHMEEMEE